MHLLFWVACNCCDGAGYFNDNPRHFCVFCDGKGQWPVDAREESPDTFLDFYGSRRGKIMPEHAASVTGYLVARGWTWHDVGPGAPDWLVLPEGPSRFDFQEESRERARLAKGRSNVIPFRRTA